MITCPHRMIGDRGRIIYVRYDVIVYLTMQRSLVSNRNSRALVNFIAHQLIHECCVKSEGLFKDSKRCLSPSLMRTNLYGAQIAARQFESGLLFLFCLGHVQSVALLRTIRFELSNFDSFITFTEIKCHYFKKIYQLYQVYTTALRYN